ncbi:MAG: porin family protein [Bacteroidota bacterium]|nr:porin family protein [Bacteroidota bacterium]
MDEDLHDIEDLFFDALDDNEESPPPNVWDGVEKRLDKDNIVSIKKKYTTLKRIAILLLLLLGISIYEIDRIYNNNNLAKNNSAQPQRQNGTEIKEQTASLKNGNALKESIEAGGVNKPDKENGTLSNNSVRKQNTPLIINPVKNILKTPPLPVSSTKKRLTSEPSFKSKIKNVVAVEEEQLTFQINSENDFYQTPYVVKQKNTSIENMILQSKNSISLKESRHLAARSATRVSDTSNNNNIAEIKKKKNEKLSRLSITPFFSPDVAWYHLQDDVSTQSGNASDIEKEEKHEFSFTYGALADYRINKHWGVQSGLTFSNTNITTEPEIIYAQPDNTGNIKYRINTSSGYGFILPSYSANPKVGDSLYAFTSTHSLRYIGIPAAFTYSIIKNKFTFSARAGISTNFLTRARLETTVEKGFDNSTETVDNIQGLKKLYFTGLASLGIDFQLNKKTAIAFVPTMRFALNSINKNAPVKSYPMTFGSLVGLKIGL